MDPHQNATESGIYKVFWTNIKSMLIDSYIFSHDKGQVSGTQQRGVMWLIHKGKELPRDKLTDWRPITPLNTDYKNLAKTIALRLNRVISTLIAEDQCGFIKGRNIATILSTTDDVINYLDQENQPGILIGIDFTKAFDTINKTLRLSQTLWIQRGFSEMN